MMSSNRAWAFAGIVCMWTIGVTRVRAGFIQQIVWSGGTQAAAPTALSSTTESETLWLAPFDPVDGTRALTAVSYRVRCVGSQDWVADNDDTQQATVYSSMSRAGEVRFPENSVVYQTGNLFQTSASVALAPDTEPDGEPDTSPTTENGDTTGWLTETADWGWSSSQLIPARHNGLFVTQSPVPITLQPTLMDSGISWDTNGLREVLFANPGFGIGLEVTYDYEPIPEPGTLLTLMLCLPALVLFRRSTR